MENEEFETYEVVDSESDYEDYDDEMLLSDYVLVTFLVIIGCAVFAFIVKTISKHLKNVHLKLGNKIEIGVESKDTKEISHKEDKND